MVQRLLMRVQLRIRRSLPPQQVVSGFARTCRQHRRGLGVRVEGLRVGVQARGRRGHTGVLGVSPLGVVLRVRVVSLIGQFAAKLLKRRAPPAVVVVLLLLRVGAHLVVRRDHAGLLLQDAEHQALPLGEQARPGELRTVQSDPVSVRALQHR